MLRSIGFVTCLALLMVACGGGGGGGGGGATYTVGGTVTGLTGSGLILRNNGGGNLAVPVSGMFTFATKVANGAAYAVTVGTQPTNPAQTCVVTNGSGTMGSSNVTNVTVTCTLNGFTGFISGPYLYTDISGFGASSGPDLFDGAGGYSGSYVENDSGVISSGSFSGTYTAAAGGGMSLNGLDGGVSADGNTILFADLLAGDSAYVDVEIKQGQANFTNADFIGTYQLASINSFGNGGGSLTLTADGMGSYSGTAVRNNAGVITSGAVSGTYAVAADGSLTITPASGSPFTGGISADGKTLVLSQLTAAQPAEFAVGIKQGQSTLTNADVIGTYMIIYYDGFTDILLTLSFDGAGLLQGTGTFNDGGTISSNQPVTGAYTVAADGSMTLTPTGATLSFTGGVSADGNTLMLTNLNAGNTPSIQFGVRR